MEDNPEPEPILSITPSTQLSMLPTASLVPSCTTNLVLDPKSDSIPSITSTSPPNTPSCTGVVHEPKSVSGHEYLSLLPSTSSKVLNCHSPSILSWREKEDLFSSRNGTIKSGEDLRTSAPARAANVPPHTSRVRSRRLGFVPSSHEDAYERKLKTYSPMRLSHLLCGLRRVHTCIPQHRLLFHVYQHLL